MSTGSPRGLVVHSFLRRRQGNREHRILSPPCLAGGAMTQATEAAVRMDRHLGGAMVASASKGVRGRWRRASLAPDQIGAEPDWRRLSPRAAPQSLNAVKVHRC